MFARLAIGVDERRGEVQGWPSTQRELHVAGAQLQRLVIAMRCCPEQVLSGAGPKFRGLGLERLGRTACEGAVLVYQIRQIRP